MVRRLAKRIAPEPTRYLAELRYLRRETKPMRGQLDCRDLDAVGAVLAHPGFRAEQKPSEVLQLLKVLKAASAKRFCEIGAHRGGTLALFSTAVGADARILSIDIGFSHTRTLLNPVSVGQHGPSRAREQTPMNQSSRKGYLQGSGGARLSVHRRRSQLRGTPTRL
jgi:predicted O-methyltransferase YrrM